MNEKQDTVNSKADKNAMCKQIAEMQERIYSQFKTSDDAASMQALAAGFRHLTESYEVAQRIRVTSR